MKINNTDLKLIAELQRDGSIHYSDLAANLGITPKTAAKRVGRLIKSNIITIRAQPNPYKLGLCSSAVIAIKVDRSQIEHICGHLCELFCVSLVQTVFGRFDIMIIVFFPNLESLHQFIYDDLYAIDGVKKVEYHIVREVFKRYDRFFQKEPFAGDQLKLKEIDWTLIRNLARDGRTSTSDLAEKLGLHVTTLYKRINALQKNKIIKISGVPNPSRLTSSASAYIVLEAEPSELGNICNSLYANPEVHFIMTLHYRSGAIFCVHTKNNETLYEFITHNISPLKGLIDTETIIRAMVQKTYYWSIHLDEMRRSL